MITNPHSPRKAPGLRRRSRDTPGESDSSESFKSESPSPAKDMCSRPASDCSGRTSAPACAPPILTRPSLSRSSTSDFEKELSGSENPIDHLAANVLARAALSRQSTGNLEVEELTKRCSVEEEEEEVEADDEDASQSGGASLADDEDEAERMVPPTPIRVPPTPPVPILAPPSLSPHRMNPSLLAGVVDCSMAAASSAPASLAPPADSPPEGAREAASAGVRDSRLSGPHEAAEAREMGGRPGHAREPSSLPPPPPEALPLQLPLPPARPPPTARPLPAGYSTPPGRPPPGRPPPGRPPPDSNGQVVGDKWLRAAAEEEAAQQAAAEAAARVAAEQAAEQARRKEEEEKAAFERELEAFEEEERAFNAYVDRPPLLPLPHSFAPSCQLATQPRRSAAPLPLLLRVRPPPRRHLLPFTPSPPALPLAYSRYVVAEEAAIAAEEARLAAIEAEEAKRAAEAAAKAAAAAYRAATSPASSSSPQCSMRRVGSSGSLKAAAASAAVRRERGTDYSRPLHTPRSPLSNRRASSRANAVPAVVAPPAVIQRASQLIAGKLVADAAKHAVAQAVQPSCGPTSLLRRSCPAQRLTTIVKVCSVCMLLVSLWQWTGVVPGVGLLGADVTRPLRNVVERQPSPLSEASNADG